MALESPLNLSRIVSRAIPPFLLPHTKDWHRIVGEVRAAPPEHTDYTNVQLPEMGSKQRRYGPTNAAKRPITQWPRVRGIRPNRRSHNEPGSSV